LEEEGVDVRKSHLNEVRKIYGGNVDFSTFRIGVRFAIVGTATAAGGYFTLYASTSRDANFKARMETNLNKVAEQVREYEKPGDFADQCFVRLEEGDNEHIALFQGNNAYLAVRNYLPVVDRVNVFQGPLQITDMAVFRDRPEIEADLPLGGRSAREDVAAAHRINIAAGMLQEVISRKADVSFRTAVRDWSQAYRYDYPDAGAFMYKQDSKWVRIDFRAGDVPEALQIPEALKSGLEDVRGDLRDADLVEFGAYRYEAVVLLPEMRKIAVQAGNLVGYDASDGKNDICTAWGYGCDGITDATYGIDGGAGGWYDICAPGDCGGINEVVGGSFGDRLRMMLAAYIIRVDAAIAADSSLSAEEIKKLQSELSGILRAFRSHVDGSLHQIKGEKMLARQAVKPTDALLEDSHIRLSEMASDLAVMYGWVDALRPEEPYVTARKIRYSVKHKDHDGRLITMLRVKEGAKPSVYLTWVQGGNDVHYCL
jgi:hypothetical protein